MKIERFFVQYDFLHISLIPLLLYPTSQIFPKMSSQPELKPFTISLANAVHSNAVTLISRLSLVDKPMDDIPLLPGEYIHIGYTPMTEKEAFSSKRAPLIPPQMTLPFSHFRMAREDVDIDELVDIIHRFIAINDAV